ncbi:hypothetical protein [Streptomyces alfalfae]
MTDSTPEFKPGGGVPTAPQYATPKSLGRIVVINTARAQLAETRAVVDALAQHMAAQDPEQLEQLSPDAMTVTFDRTTERKD